MLRVFFYFLTSLALATTPSPEDEKLDIPFQGNCGLVTRWASNRIPPECLSEALNLLYDEDLTLSRRQGQSKYNATGCAGLQAVRGLWPFNGTDGTRYMAILSSVTMFQTSGSGDCTAIPGLSGLSQTAAMDCVQTIGRLWCTNGTDTPFSWTGTSTSPVSAMPSANLIGAFRNRVLVADVAGNLTRLRLSGELDGTDWAIQIPGRSTTPASIDIAGTNDGKKVTCLLGEYQNAFFIGREDELYALYGNSRLDFTLRKISNEVGCIESKSIREKNNSLYWVSKRGIEKLTGTTISRISDPIRPTVDTIIQAAGNSRTKTLTSQSDWSGGASNAQASGAGAKMSTSLSPGNVVSSSWAVTDTSDQDFGVFTSSLNISTSVVPGSLTLKIATYAFVNGDFSNGDFTNWDKTGGWSIATGVIDPLAACPGSTNAGAYDTCLSGNPQTYKFELLDVSGISIKNCTAFLGCGGIGKCQYSSDTCDAHDVSSGTTRYIMNVSTFVGTFKIKITSQNGGTLTSPINPDAGQVSVRLNGDTSPCAANKYTEEISTCKTIRYLNNGTFLSKNFDTSFSTPTYGLMNTSNSGLQLITIETQSSNDNVTYSSLETATNNIQIPSPSRKFLRYKATLSTTDNTVTPRMDDISLSARTTGYYITDCINSAGTISSWGSFRGTKIDDGGSFTFYLSTGASCGFVTASTANWTQQTLNSAIVLPTATFTAARVLFSMAVGTSNPTLNDLTWEWNEGSNRPKTASAVYRDRYWLFYTTSTLGTPVNDHALVLDQNDKWTLFDGVTAHSAALWNNKLYTGDSNNTGTVFQQDIGQDDAGNSFVMRFRSPDIDFGDPERLKSFRLLYATLKSRDDMIQDINLQFLYYIDGSTVSYSLGACNLGEAVEPGYFTCKMPFPTSQQTDGHLISIAMTYNGAQGGVHISKMTLYYTRKEYD